MHASSVFVNVNTQQLIEQYLAGVLAALLVSSADHVIQDIHLLDWVRAVHLLT